MSYYQQWDMSDPYVTQSDAMESHINSVHASQQYPVSKLHEKECMMSQVKGDLICLVRDSIAKIHYDWKATWGGKCLFHLHFQITVYITEESQGRNLSRKSFKSQRGMLFTVFSRWFAQLFSYIIEYLQVRCAPTKCELCPPRLVISQKEKVLQPSKAKPSKA